MTQPEPTPSPSPSTPPDHVVLQDAFGRRQQMPREQYRTTVLPELLKQVTSDPERLTAVILQALRDGFQQDLLAAANRLTVIDKDLERALSVVAMVQRANGELQDAEASLQELLQRRPNSTSARVGLALLREQQGQLAEAERLLREALLMDPNHADAVHGLLALRHRVVGDAGYRAELEQVAASGSWRGKLWLARHLLQSGARDLALPHYREVLTANEVASDALVMASADLVQAGEKDLTEALVAKRFQPGQHHPHVGLALLHHYLQTNNDVAGAALLHQMYLHYGHMVGADLHPFTAQFDRMRLSKLPTLPSQPSQPKIGLFRFERPLWCAGLEDPHWLLPRKAADHRTVLCFPLAVESEQPIEAGMEDELGRLSRAVPLYLSEQITLASPHQGCAGLFLAEHGGWVVMGRQWPEEQLVQQLPAEQRASTLVIAGALRLNGEQRRIDVWLYDCAKKERVGHAAAEGKREDLGSMLLQLQRELWPALGGPEQHQPPVDKPAYWGAYAEGLAQQAALLATQAGGLAKERLYGERYIVQWLQNTMLLEPRWQPGFWLFASALCVLDQLGSPVPKEFARVFAELFRQAPPTSPLARFALLPLRAVGLAALWEHRRAEIEQANAQDPGYLAWLSKVSAAVAKA